MVSPPFGLHNFHSSPPANARYRQASRNSASLIFLNLNATWVQGITVPVYSSGRIRSFPKRSKNSAYAESPSARILRLNVTWFKWLRLYQLFARRVNDLIAFSSTLRRIGWILMKVPTKDNNLASERLSRHPIKSRNSSLIA